MNIIELIEIAIGFFLTFAFFYILRPIWNRYLSKITWSRKLFDCKHKVYDKMLTFAYLVIFMVFFIEGLMWLVQDWITFWPFKIGAYLALPVLLCSYMWYQVSCCKFRCVWCIVFYVIIIIFLLLAVSRILLENPPLRAFEKPFNMPQKP